MAREVLVVSVHDVSLEDLKTRIAKVTSGQWMTLAGETRLVPDKGLRAKQEQVEYDRRLAQIEKNLEAIAKPDDAQDKADLSKTGADAPPALKKALESFLSSYPVSLAAKLLAEQDASLFAKMVPNDRIVFASTPNGSQLLLAGYSEEMLADFVSKYNSLLSALAESPKSASDFGLGDGPPGKPIAAAPAKMLLIVSEPTTGGFAAQVKLYGPKGEVVYSEESSFSDGPGDVEEVDAPPAAQTEKHAKSDPNSKPVALSPECAAAMKALSNAAENRRGQPASKEVVERLTHPEQYDPLSFYPSEALLQRAGELGAQLVADIPDEIHEALEYNPKATASEFMDKVLSEDGGVKLEQAGSWMLVWPSDPVDERLGRIDRSALGRLVRAGQSKGAPSLDDLADFALSITSRQLDTMTECYLMLFAPNAIGSLGDGLDGLRFYGLLDSQQRQILTSGTPLAIRSLTPDETNILDRMTYGAETALLTSDPVKTDPAMQGMLAGVDPNAASNPPETYLTEPTESLAGGLPPNGSLTMRLATATVAVPVDSMFPPLDAERMAYAELSKQRRPNSAYAQLTKFRVGRRTTINLDFRLGGELWSNTLLTDVDPNAHGSTLKAEDLPDDFKQEIAARLEEIKKRLAANPRRGRVVNPPPSQ